MLSVPTTVALFLGVASQIQAAQPPQHPSGDGTTKGTKLHPNVHWSYDTKPVTNVLPVEPNEGAELYYGVGNASESGHFAFLTYYFTLPSINIDHTDHITVRYDDHDVLVASFQTKEAFDHAFGSWSVDRGLLIIAHVEGCEAHGRGERCYFSVTELEFQREHLSVVAKGSSKHPDEVTISGETEWGWWDAGQGNTATDGVLASRSPSSSRAMGHHDCVAGSNDETGLPTACLGPGFDQSLDEKLGHEKLNIESRQYLKQLKSRNFGGFRPDDFASSSPDASSRSRVVRWSGRRSLGSGVDEFYKRAAHDDYKATSDAHSMGVGGGSEFSVKIPDHNSSDSKAWSLLSHLILKNSPWGKAIRLGTFETEAEAGFGKKAKSLEVYCVNCSVSGQARVAGHAKWSTAHGVHGGTVDLTTDLQMVLNIGLSGTGGLEKEFELDLFTYGLPGLSYGVVTIGPYLSLSARAVINLELEGTLLAGGEMASQGARVVMDLADSSVVGKSGQSSSTFKPSIETEGKVSGSVELGLPFGLKCGLKISKWEAAIGLVDEPSLKASLSHGKSHEMHFNGTKHGEEPTSTSPKHGSQPTSTRIKHNVEPTSTSTKPDKEEEEPESECAGLLAELSWRNRLFVGVVDVAGDGLFDTDDQVLASKCLE
ncbi:hypothetical protein E4U53_004298 [Claviceps sorghi]|nr:hypothetical protein E4U53_004298 [Claviceps sorghi]